MDNSDDSADGMPPTVHAARRSLVVLAGLPGAGKSTVLANLHGTPEISILDSDQVRRRLRVLLPEGVPYRWYRPAVHTVHRTRIGLLCAMRAGPVVAHEPSTRPTTRAMLVLFGWATGRQRVLVWLDTPPAEALAGQHERGRLIRARSFRQHVRRAARVQRILYSGGTLWGWGSVRVFGRAELARGLRLEVRG